MAKRAISLPLPCAVVGVGYLGKFHAEKYAASLDAKLVAVCDFDSKTAATIGQKHGVPAFTNYRELLGKVSAVSIATPSTTHFEVAKFFLENGVHVLLEKPIAATSEEAMTLTKLAQKNKNLVFTVGHLERFSTVFLELKKRVKNPVFIETRRTGPFKNRTNDVSIIVDLMIHDIDLVMNIANSKVKSIRAFGKKIFTNLVDFAIAEITFQNGCVAHLTASRITPLAIAERRINILEDAVYYSSDLNQKTVAIARRPENKTLPIAESDLINETLTLPKNDGLADEIAAFINAISTSSKTIITAKEASVALDVAFKIELLANCYERK